MLETCVGKGALVAFFLLEFSATAIMHRQRGLLIFQKSWDCSPSLRHWILQAYIPLCSGWHVDTVASGCMRLLVLCIVVFVPQLDLSRAFFQLWYLLDTSPTKIMAYWHNLITRVLFPTLAISNWYLLKKWYIRWSRLCLLTEVNCAIDRFY